MKNKAEYIAAVSNMDWAFQFSDDNRPGGYYQRGRDELARLRALQPLFDPDASIWNAACTNPEYAINKEG